MLDIELRHVRRSSTLSVEHCTGGLAPLNTTEGLAQNGAHFIFPDSAWKKPEDF